MPRLSDPRITKGHAASFLVRLYLQEPEFLSEFRQLRQNHAELLAKVLVTQVEFLVKCREVLSIEKYQKMVRALYQLPVTRRSIPTLPENLTRQLEQMKQMYVKLEPYFHDLEQLASRWKLKASWAGPMLYLYHIHDCLRAAGVPDGIDVPLEQLDLLYPWPPPIPPLEIKVSAWAFVLYGRKQIQLDIAKKLKNYEDRLKTLGLKEKPSALDNHAQWWFQHYVKGRKYREINQQFPLVEEETIKRKVYEFSKLAGIRTR
ncbi:MAG: hypothetical protein DRI01_01610 [Chloroflexi bacterium]|nr:MAG: hypothetical protein DRI01_01610 [Chloroflexota bacterium]